MSLVFTIFLGLDGFFWFFGMGVPRKVFLVALFFLGYDELIIYWKCL